MQGLKTKYFLLGTLGIFNLASEFYLFIVELCDDLREFPYLFSSLDLFTNSIVKNSSPEGVLETGGYNPEFALKDSLRS